MTKVSNTTHFTFVAATSHRRPGSLGGAMIDWLMANARSNAKEIIAAGHDGKHLRWDLEHNPNLFRHEEKNMVETVVTVEGVEEKVINTEWVVTFEPAVGEEPAAVPSTEPAEGVDNAEPAAAEMSIGEALSDIVGRAVGIAEELRDVAAEEQEYYDNMPEGIQNGDKGQAATDEVDAIEAAAEALEAVAELETELA